MITSDVENYPGYPDGHLGPEMMQDFRRQAKRFGAEFITDDVTRVDFSKQPFRVWIGDHDTRSRTSSLPQVRLHASSAWSPSRSCRDAALSVARRLRRVRFRDQQVIDVGGVDSALEEAIFLAKFDEVEPSFTGGTRFSPPIMVDRENRTSASSSCSTPWSRTYGESDEGRMTGVLRGERQAPARRATVAADGLPSRSSGHDPTTSLFEGIVDMDEAGYIVTKGRRPRPASPACSRPRRSGSRDRQAVTGRRIRLPGRCWTLKRYLAALGAGESDLAAVDGEFLPGTPRVQGIQRVSAQCRLLAGGFPMTHAGPLYLRSRASTHA